MHWCSGTVSREGVQVSARSRPPGVNGNPTYSPINTPPRLKVSSCETLVQSPDRSTCANAGRAWQHVNNVRMRTVFFTGYLSLRQRRIDLARTRLELRIVRFLLETGREHEGLREILRILDDLHDREPLI